MDEMDELELFYRLYTWEKERRYQVLRECVVNGTKVPEYLTDRDDIARVAKNELDTIRGHLLAYHREQGLD